jgi:hypothetical protein
MLGDILDPLQSTLWLDKNRGEPGYVRPWTDFRASEFAERLRQITRAILENNAEATHILKNLTHGKGLKLPPANSRGRPILKPLCRTPVPVRIHYMVGNHDWYYHIPGTAFDAIRQEIVDACGLSNSASPFPHESKESEEIANLLGQYKVYAQHGDIYDSFNFDAKKGRNAATLGDAFSVEVLNRFPVEAERRLGDELPKGLIESFSELVNVRPALATPLWISGQLRQNNIPEETQKKLKAVWDELGDEFLALPIVREADQPFKLDIVDGLEALIHLTQRASFKTIDEVVVWLREKLSAGEVTFTRHALKEEAFIKRKVQFIVYGHTHHHEIVPLDTIPAAPRPTNQMYLNSGTWHTYYDLAVYKPEEQKFISYQVLTYLSFYKDDERSGRRFEAWSGAFSE